MVFLTENRIRDYFSDFQIEHFEEEDRDGASGLGPKHWHVFHIIAKKV